MTNQKVVILIPAYQPSTTLINVVNDLLQHESAQIIQSIVLVDDGSGQDYQATFAQLSTLPKVHICAHAINLGKGAALKTGFNHILLAYQDIHSIVTADADGQHLPDDILNVAQYALSQPKNCLTLGVRTFSKQVPLRSLFGNQLTRSVMRFFTGLKLADTQTGLRAWPLELAQQTLRFPINGYDFEMEALVRMKELSGKHQDITLQEVPIQTVYEQDNKSSHFNPLLDSMRIYFVFLRYCGAGLFTALVDNIIFIIMYMLSGSIISSQITSRSCGALVSFILSFHLVFRSNVNKVYALLKFISLVILFGFISYSLIQFLSQVLGLNVFISKLLAELILFVASFAIQRDFIFNKSTDDTEA
ncbi:bifunctional glycosyltransferase family 2/GtrA family protein [Candidatus Albibeggiatoa sp. nov. NOAA]|uniref:bifunctional glycosyltransferase family 2/GtrA family protein n=1 Tax=Candidatus Albibeggiatoa sp. nov. NOAA TaxID=3162724 RepID=UPI0032F40F77|nr:bifunctional glycosyltransferase family 2/GtrA family protein [Thiotrichaceae bacterium]